MKWNVSVRKIFKQTNGKFPEIPVLAAIAKKFQTNQWKIPENPRTCRYRKKFFKQTNEKFPEIPVLAAIAKKISNKPMENSQKSPYLPLSQKKNS